MIKLRHLRFTIYDLRLTFDALLEARATPGWGEFGLRWQAKRDTAFALANTARTTCARRVFESAVADSLCQSSPKRLRRGRAHL
jgi:hypothetical protein